MDLSVVNEFSTGEYPQRVHLLGTYVLRHSNMLPLIFKIS